MSAVPNPVESVPVLVARLYEIVAEFERLFPDRRFTPDGHLVGSIGEVVAAYRYGLSLRSHSAHGYDAISSKGVKVEIKATQGSSVALREQPEHLIVLHLAKSGVAVEVYNGPGAKVWSACGGMQRNGQRHISLYKLRDLITEVPIASRLPIVRS